MLHILLETPKREYLIFFLIPVGLLINAYFPEYRAVLLLFASFGAYPVVLQAFESLLEWRLSVELFNSFALIATFALGDIYAGSFIVLMLAFARVLAERVKNKEVSYASEIESIRPSVALREHENMTSSIAIERVRKDDIIVVKKGEVIPVDGIVVFGKTTIDESFVSGDATKKEKIISDTVLAGSLNISAPIKIRALYTGVESVLEKKLMLFSHEENALTKEEILAARVERFFYPTLLAAGIGIFVVLDDLFMTAAFFLVASTYELSEALPQVIRHARSHAASMGYVFSGGKVFQLLNKSKTLVLNKTKLLSFGTLAVSSIHIQDGVNHEDFWQAIAIAEKYSEQPVGNALFREAVKNILTIPDAQKFQVYKGAGVYAKYGKDEIVVGNSDMLKQYKLSFPRGFKKNLEETYQKKPDSIVYVGINGVFVGYLTIIETHNDRVAQSIARLKKMGFSRVVLFTEDKEIQTMHVAEDMGIQEYYFSLSEDDKIAHIKRLTQSNPVTVIGDGVTDEKLFARSSVGIAVGKNGKASKAKNADIVVLHENFETLPDIVSLSRSTSNVLSSNMYLWILSNSIGFCLVIVFHMQPWLAAFYRFSMRFASLYSITRLYPGRTIQDII